MFVHTAPIYTDVFSIFNHTPQLSCSRNNTKMARVNSEICTVLRYRCFCRCFEYTTYTNMSVFGQIYMGRIQILRIKIRFLLSCFDVCPHSTDLRRRVFDILPFSTAQARAKIKLLRVSENGRPPYWHSISGFDFDVCIVIGMTRDVAHGERSMQDAAVPQAIYNIFIYVLSLYIYIYIYIYIYVLSLIHIYTQQGAERLQYQTIGKVYWPDADGLRPLGIRPVNVTNNENKNNKDVSQSRRDVERHNRHVILRSSAEL